MAGLSNRGKDVAMLGLIIDGAERPSSDNASFERRNPISDAVVTQAAAATDDDAIDAVDAAAAAFPEWSATPPRVRRDILMAAAENLTNKMQFFVDAMMSEIGATEGWAQFNVTLAAEMLREAAAMTSQIGGEIIPSNRPGTSAMAVRRAAGVVLSIAPWNAPVILGVRSLAMPIACGNTVVMKTSEVCPRTHRLIVDAINQAGLPDGVLNAISNAPEDAGHIVATLIAQPAVRRINFTGSTRVGRIVSELAGKHLKPTLMELGGKAPFVVLEDADIDAAVEAAAFGAFMNQGQICMSTERIIVDDAIADRFVEALAVKTRTLRAGDPSQSKSALGGVVDASAAARIGDLIKDATAKGAVIKAGGTIDGTIVQPTVLDHISPSMWVYTDESFGPIAAVIRVGGVDEAVRVANDTEYGLSAAVFGKDVMRAMKVAQRIETGICHINGPTVHDEAQMPFGGMKASGFGRFGGKEAISEFTELRWITVQDGPLHYPF